MKDINEIWDFLVEYNIATREELELITSINGYKIETLNEVIYARTGFIDIQQLKEDE